MEAFPVAFSRASLTASAAALFLMLGGTMGAIATECPGNPNALGTSRVLTIDPAEYPRIGTIQYSHSLPLEDREVVLTFDDGPMPPYTLRVLEVLAEQCVKANYFIIGRMARGYPDLIKRIRADGHVIGNHSENHPLAFERMPLGAIKEEIEQGFASIGAALGDRSAVAPFFRIPGLLRAQHVEGYLQARQTTVWSADVVADDWKHISAADVVRRAMARLDEKGKGILLLHDIQPATALALPELLRQLKARGYRIVQVVPGKPERSKGVPVATRTAPPPVAEPARLVPPPAVASPQVVSKIEAVRPEAASKPELVNRPEAIRTPAIAANAQAPAVAVVTQPAAPAPAPQLAPPPPTERQAMASAPIAPEPPPAPPPALVIDPAMQAAAVEPEPQPEPEPAHAEPPAVAAVQAPAALPAPAVEPAAAKPAFVAPSTRPFTAELKSAQSVSAHEKVSNRQLAGWPRIVSVPVPRAGGVGASSVVARTGPSRDGRFQAPH